VQFHDFDGEYLERLRAGDFRTQEHFVRYFSELMQIKLRFRLRSAEEIEDVRQETFARVLTALRSSGDIREPEKLGAFVNSTCNFVAMELYRDRSRRSAPEEEEVGELPDPSETALDVLIQEQAASNVRRVIDELPERDRRLMREVFLEERDKDEVCRDFGVDRGYLRVLLHRAKQSFRSLYLKPAARAGPVREK